MTLGLGWVYWSNAMDWPWGFEGIALWSKILLCEARYCFMKQGICETRYYFVTRGIALWSTILLCGARYCFVMQGIAFWRKLLLCDARYCFLTQGIALWHTVLLCDARYCFLTRGIALWCKVLLFDARYCFVTHGIALWCKVLLCDTRYCFLTQGIALWHKVLLCDTKYCFVMQSIALWCKVLFCDAWYCFVTQGIALQSVCFSGCNRGVPEWVPAVLHFPDVLWRCLHFCHPCQHPEPGNLCHGCVCAYVCLSVMFLLVSAQWSEDSRCASCSKVTLNRVCTLTNIPAWFPFCSAIADVFVGVCVCVGMCLCARVCMRMGIALCVHFIHTMFQDTFVVTLLLVKSADML